MARPDLLKISFEFSSKLGVRELPKINKDHESNIPGMYVVGDLADAPIIKVALNQGFEVANKVVAGLGKPGQDTEILDVVVIGAGPAGIGAALALKDAGSSFVVLEKERPFQTIQNFPKAKFIFSEPREMINRGNFWFEDAKKEELVERWRKALDDKALPIQQPEEVVSAVRKEGIFEITTKIGAGGLESAPLNPAGSAEGETNVYKARKVILAIGRRGSVNRMNVPGEEAEKVAYALKDPQDYAGSRLTVFGGGDSAVEAAMSCAEAGAEVTISYRGDSFARAKPANRANIEKMIAAKRIRAEYNSKPVEVKEDQVVLERDGETFQVPNDKVLVFFGTRLPSGFLKKLGIRMAGEMDWGRLIWITSFALFTYLFYVLKTGKSFFPFGEGHILGWVPGALHVDIGGYRTLTPSFWGTCIYSITILVFGIMAYKRFPSPTQKKRYMSLIGFQWIFLFGIPELLAPLIIDRYWKMYTFSVPWPLNIYSMIDAPSWANGNTMAVVLWLGVGAVTSFVLIPLYVRYQGERFCSYLCGCGGLAETLGDFWRHLAPRGKTSYQSEWFGRAILLMAIPVTLLILNDAWSFFKSGALTNSKVFAEHWYMLMVDFWLANVLGVAFYPYLGNRVWCRFFCPLRAYMEILSRKFSKIAIKANEKCIGCGECTRFCQMGIDVQKFAQRQETFDNANSSCIQCGICIQVCPMDVLSIGERDGTPSPAGSIGPSGHLLGKRSV